MINSFSKTVLGGMIFGSAVSVTPAFAQYAGATFPEISAPGLPPEPNYTFSNLDRHEALARAAIVRKDYATAEDILSNMASSAFNARIYYLAGFASAGNDHLKASRHYLKRAVAIDRYSIDAKILLAMVSAKLDDKPAASRLLQQLTATRVRCGNTCADAAKLDQAVPVIRRAIG